MHLAFPPLTAFDPFLCSFPAFERVLALLNVGDARDVNYSVLSMCLLHALWLLHSFGEAYAKYLDVFSFMMSSL